MTTNITTADLFERAYDQMKEKVNAFFPKDETPDLNKILDFMADSNCLYESKSFEKFVFSGLRAMKYCMDNNLSKPQQAFAEVIIQALEIGREMERQKALIAQETPGIDELERMFKLNAPDSKT